MFFFFLFQSPLYSTVNKMNCDQAGNEDDKEHDYSSIAELKGIAPTSSSSDLYATVHDIYARPDEPQSGEEPPLDCSDPGYESIRIPNTGSSDDDHGAGIAKPEPDYESVGELGLSREMSRLWINCLTTESYSSTLKQPFRRPLMQPAFQSFHQMYIFFAA